MNALALTDTSGGIRVINLDARDLASNEAVIWQWYPSTELGWRVERARLEISIDDVKLRRFGHHGKNAVIMTASNDWAGIADLETGECLWEADVPHMPHGIEMLPNGDIVIAGSGGADYLSDGQLMYYSALEDGKYEMTDRQTLSSAHGVVWDPALERVWAIGWEEAAAYRIENGRLLPDKRAGARLIYNNGHDISADYSNPNMLLLATGHRVYMFDKANNALLSDYPSSRILFENSHVKGITSYPDGTIVYCQATGVKCAFDTDTIHILRPNAADAETVKFRNISFYKLKNFTADYQ